MPIIKVVNVASSANDKGDRPSAPLSSSAWHITPLPHWTGAQPLWTESDVQDQIWI